MLLSFPLCAFASSPSPSEKGFQIAQTAISKDQGWENIKALATMVLTNRQGQKSTRELKMQSLEQDTDGDKILIVFRQPRDIKGTALLSYTHIKRPDEQWLYLPALKRIKRIASSNMSGPFVGSEFAYEDISGEELDKYTYKYLRDESFQSMDCFVVERYPTDALSGYARQKVWYDKTEYRIQKIEFYDKNQNKLIKTLIYTGYSRYANQYWRPDKMEMVNHLTGKQTELIWNKYQFKTQLSENEFNINVLRRIR
jgi:outer membrane lipoprotein-sorting protein